MEMLVEELASAHRMLELGMTAKMRSQTVEQLPNIISELKADPTMTQKVLHDVNRTVGMIKKAENGEKSNSSRSLLKTPTGMGFTVSYRQGSINLYTDLNAEGR